MIEQCWECKGSWDTKNYYENENICPYCGTDIRNPITYYYRKKDRYDIKNGILCKKELINLNLEYFILEKQKREKTLKSTERVLNFFLETALPQIVDPDIINYCKEHYSYDISLLDLKYVDVEREIPLKFPHLYANKKLRTNVVRYILRIAVKSIAQHQLDELYEAMELRDDKGMKNED